MDIKKRRTEYKEVCVDLHLNQYPVIFFIRIPIPILFFYFLTFQKVYMQIRAKNKEYSFTLYLPTLLKEPNGK